MELFKFIGNWEIDKNFIEMFFRDDSMVYMKEKLSIKHASICIQWFICTLKKYLIFLQCDVYFVHAKIIIQ